MLHVSAGVGQAAREDRVVKPYLAAKLADAEPILVDCAEFRALVEILARFVHVNHGAEEPAVLGVATDTALFT